MIRYSEIRDDLHTGDIVLFSGNGFISKGIRFTTRSQWSHVGMVWRIPSEDMLLLAESTSIGKVSDYELKKLKKGVQIVSLKQKIATYNGDVAVRRLTADITSAQLSSIAAFRREVEDVPYEHDKIELIRSAYDGFGGQNVEDLSSLFCSEYTAEFYQRMQLLPEDIPSNEYTPSDFSSEKKLPLLRGELALEIFLKENGHVL